jgi:hypothetical protein
MAGNLETIIPSLIEIKFKFGVMISVIKDMVMTKVMILKVNIYDIILTVISLY